MRRTTDINQPSGIDARDGHGRTALMLATLRGRRAAVDALLAAGADPNAADADGSLKRTGREREHVIPRSPEGGNCLTGRSPQNCHRSFKYPGVPVASSPSPPNNHKLPVPSIHGTDPYRDPGVFPGPGVPSMP